MYCGRVSIDISNGQSLCSAFMKKFSPSKFIAYYEEKDKGDDDEKLVNPHIHFMALYSPEPKSLKQSISTFMKEYKQYCPHSGQSYYHKKCESIPNALAYTIKDGKPLYTHGFTDDEILEAENKVIEFNKDTKKSALMKLNERFQLYMEKEKLKEEPDCLRLHKKVKLFIYKIYSLEYKTEVSNSRVSSLAYQLIIMNELLTDTDLCDIM